MLRIAKSCQWRWLVASLTTLLLTGCGALSYDEEAEPVALEDFESEVRLVEQWSGKLTGSRGEKYQLLRPAFLGNRIFLVSEDGKVSAAQTEQGQRLWTTRLDTPIAGGVAAGEGLVTVTSYDGELIALSALDGSEQWRVMLSSEAIAPADISANTVTVQTIDGQVAAFAVPDGQRLWSFGAQKPPLTLRGTSQPVAEKGVVYVGMSSGKVVALSQRSGELIWESPVALPEGQTELERMVDVDGELLISNGVLFATAYQGRVAALYLVDGRVLWGRDLSSYRGTARDDQRLFAVSADGQVYAYDRSSGTELWLQQGLGFRQPTAPVYIAGTVAIADAEGYVHLLAADDGRFVGRERIDSAGISAPLKVWNGTLYVQGNSGRVTALSVEP